MQSICGVNCNECDLYKNNKCLGCNNTKGCPFGKKCWIAKYIEVGGLDSYNEIKTILIDEINSLDIDGMSKINDLYPLHGSIVNLEYLLPNKEKTKFLINDEIYLGNQIECEFNDNDIKKYYGVIGNMSFILICEYDENRNNSEIIIYKKR